MASIWTRRSLLGAAAGGIGLTWSRNTLARPRFTRDPFSLGVASGCPTSTGVVLWTRLAPEPLSGGGMPDARIPVGWEMADDEAFTRGLRKGTFHTVPEQAHSAHVEVEGLEPGRGYFYRFLAGGESSPVGRTRTLPGPRAEVDRFKLAYASCQHYEQGYFAAHRHLLGEDLDLMVFLGDYIYESSWGEDPVRVHSGGGEVTRSLAAYRNRHAQYKLDPDLQRLHGAVPWLLAWDDHEVANDYAGLDAERLDFDFAARRAAAYRAYWEHMPLRMSQRPVGSSLPLYGRLDIGRLASLHMLDGRQYRTAQACPEPGFGGGNVLPECPEVMQPERSFLGEAQERWLDRSLRADERSWSLVAQSTLVAPIDRKPGDGDLIWTDGWDGYPPARARLLKSLRRVENPLVLGGDIHMFVAADLHADPRNTKSPVVASEVCGTSISSQGLSQAQVDPVLPENPQLRLAKAETRGYVTLELRPKAASFALEGVEDVRRKDSGASTVQRFTVEPGRPGLQTG